MRTLSFRPSLPSHSCTLRLCRLRFCTLRACQNGDAHAAHLIQISQHTFDACKCVGECVLPDMSPCVQVEVRFSLELYSEMDTARWEQHLSLCRQALNKIVPIHTSLSVHLRGLASEHAAAALSDVAALLVSEAKGILAVHITGCDGSEAHEAAVAAFLRQAAPALSEVDTLTCDDCLVELPALPELRDLVVSLSDRDDKSRRERVLANYAPLLPQLRWLYILVSDNVPCAWNFLDLFTSPPTPVTHTLTDLALPTCLGDTLLKLLHDQAPALQALCVKGLLVQRDELREGLWGLRWLKVEQGMVRAEEYVEAEHLARLPRVLGAESGHRLWVVVDVLEVVARSEQVGSLLAHAHT